MGLPGYLKGLGERIGDEVHEMAEAVSILATALRYLEDHPPAMLTAEQEAALKDLRLGADRAHSSAHRLQGLIR